MPIDIRTDQTLPAFTNCSLDDNPGAATQNPNWKQERPAILEWNKKNPKNKKDLSGYDGDATGQANLYLFWETADVVDEPDRWEMTVALTKRAPEDQCTTDLTPRRCQKFRPEPGKPVRWTDTSVSDGKVVQSGEAAADQWRLVTVEKLTVTKGKNRIKIWTP